MYIAWPNTFHRCNTMTGTENTFSIDPILFNPKQIRAKTQPLTVTAAGHNIFKTG